MEIVKLLPQNFIVINKVIYYRLENGKIAVDSIDNVTIDITDKEDIELVTFNYNKKIFRFWKTKNKLFALSDRSSLQVPEDIKFVDFYSSPSYPEGIYIKYSSSEYYGVIYVSETQICSIISSKFKFIDICFENELFYATTNDDENKYYVINQGSKVLGKFPTKCKKIKNYLLFYNDNKIFYKSLEVEVPGGITSIEVINEKDITFVKVINDSGIYYYSKNIELLFGPIKKDKIVSINKKSCYIYEIINKTIVKVFYIADVDDKYICKELSCDKGICVLDDNYFATKNNEIYRFLKNEFLLILKGKDADRYTVWIKDQYSDIIAYKEGKPFYIAFTSARNNKINKEINLEWLDYGVNKDVSICKGGKEIIVINNKNGEIILEARGVKCYNAKIHVNYVGARSIYILEDENNVMFFFTLDGHRIEIDR